MRYEHTQVGYLMVYVLVFIVVLYGYILFMTEFLWPVFGLMVFVIFIVASFGSLNVVVDSSEVRLKFGYGLFRKRFLIKEISSVKIVRNPWYVGWGIRWKFPKTWVFNVSGFDAVELRMKNGRAYRIGTDEPKKLERVLKELIK